VVVVVVVLEWPLSRLVLPWLTGRALRVDDPAVAAGASDLSSPGVVKVGSDISNGGADGLVICPVARRWWGGTGEWSEGAKVTTWLRVQNCNQVQHVVKNDRNYTAMRTHVQRSVHLSALLIT
jgi:hypothetical protein